MGSSCYESLPVGWRTICTKGHAEEHNWRCFNWISPQGRKYREWAEVQAYFQLQNFETEIPGVECRPENAERDLADQQENVTLEENTKKESTGSISAVKGKAVGKRKKRVNSVQGGNKEEEEEEEEPKPKKRGRKKKDEVDEDYVPEAESKKTSTKSKKSPGQKKPQTKQVAVVKEPTLDETPDVNETKDQLMKPEMKAGESVETVAVLPAVPSTAVEIPPVTAKTTSQVSSNNPSQVSSPANNSKITPQSKVKVETYKSAPTQVKQQTPRQVTAKVRPQTPSQGRPQVRPQTPKQGQSQVTQQAPSQVSSQVRSQTPRQGQSQIRQQAPSQITSQTRAQTPGQDSAKKQIRPAAPRQMTPGQLRGATASTPQPLAGVRAVRPARASVSTPPQRPAGLRLNESTPVRTPGAKPGGATATPPSRVRQQSPAVKPQTGGQDARYSEVPALLRSLIKFPGKLETNSGSGSSLYEAAAQHTSLGRESWAGLRRYCHGKMAEWWQWYQPYYSFPLQVKMKREGGQLTQKTIPNAGEFLKFLKTEESLYSFYISECELYCLANILGITINILTYTGQGKQGKWDNFDPHQGLIHNNKFRGNNKEAMYCLHEDKVRFNRLVKLK